MTSRVLGTVLTVSAGIRHRSVSIAFPFSLLTGATHGSHFEGLQLPMCEPA